MDISQIFVVGLHIIILSFQQTYGSISSFLPTGTVKVGEEFQISCKINSFPSRDDATLNRNGSLLNTCFQDGGCNRGDSQNIDGAVFSFTGDAEGIHLTINHLPQSEVGLLYVCIKDGSVEYTVAISSSGSDGGSTGLKWWEILLIVLGVLGALSIIGFIVKFYCISNTRCKGQESKVNITPNESRVNITSNEHIEIPTSKSEPHKKEVTPYQDGKETIIPTNKSSYKEVTPNQVNILKNELNIVKSSIAATPPRSGSKQPLHPLNNSGGGNGNGDDLP